MRLGFITLLLAAALLSGCAVNGSDSILRRTLNGSRGDVSVIIFSSTDCPIANALAPEIERMHQDMKLKGGELFLVHVWEGRTNTDTVKHAKEYGLTMEVFVDTYHELVKKFNATITPEAVVLRYDRTGKPVVVYQGLINNLFDTPGNRRDEATQHYVRDAIIAAYEGNNVTPNYRSPRGCVIEQMQ